MAATIHDVARLAQVAISTVSKVMSDSPRISAETKLRVRNAMLTLDYHPSRNARGLAKNTTETLGILMPLERDCAFRNPYVFEILCGIESLCSQHSYSVTLLNAMQLANNRSAIKRLIAERQVDGFILHATQDAPLLIKLGQLSYGIYLWHYPVVRYLRADYSWPVVVIVGLLISTALSALSFYTVECWALQRRDAGKLPERQPPHLQEPVLREATRNS